ncbi:MAG: YwaF family protein [Propionibacteriaceae bacterium]|nr:YwaF family protein [Propionibacteriaceae bacterium]
MDGIFNILFTQQVPESTLWTPWDPMQWVYLVLGILGIVLVLRWMTHVAPEKQSRVVAFVAAVVFSMWIIPPVLQCITDTGERWIDHIPLHLCSSACILIPIGLLARNKPLMNYAYGLCLAGAVAAVVFPGELYRRLSTYSFHFFLFNFSHMCIIVACLAPIALGFFRPQWRYYLSSVGIGIALMGIAYPINKVLGSNYFFVNWPEKGTILESFANIAGRAMYIPVLIVVAGIVIALLFAIWTVITRVRKPAAAIPVAG